LCFSCVHRFDPQTLQEAQGKTQARAREKAASNWQLAISSCVLAAFIDLIFKHFKARRRRGREKSS
jgi:hypothetical protein